MPKYPMPLCRVEIAIQSLMNGHLCTLFIERQEEPFKGSWGLPGGVLRVDVDKDLDAAALRVAKERLGVIPTGLKQLIAVGAKGRDPRGPQEWGLSVVFYALVPEGSVVPSAGKRVSDLQWFGADERTPKMAFDHANLVAQAVQATRINVASLQFPTGFVPERFTLGELQQLCEGVLGRGIDKASFRRKLRDRSLVEQVKGEEQRGNAHRPSAIYQLAD
jgi:ADP-ribose pyrophosphatase YjhB (NUDIX family)